MNRILTYLTIWVLGFTNTQAQEVFYQDVIQGGVTGGGFTTCLGSGNGQIEVFIDPGSQIKRAYLFCQRFGYPKPTSIIFNHEILEFNHFNQVTGGFWLPSTGESGVHSIDVTQWVSPSQNIYEVEIPPPNMSDQCLANCVYGAIYLCVIYENNSLPETAVTIMLNNQDMVNNEIYNFTELNPINTAYPVGLSLHTDRLNDTSLNDGSYVYFNSNQLGLIGGADVSNSNWGCGTKGHFYYQNNQFFGLDDDVPNSSMSGSDAIADVSSYLNNNVTSGDLHFVWQSPNTFYNIYIAFFLTYTTPCSSFPTALTVSDTTICEGEPLQLGASGGINYDWLPQTGLSCYDCPNPVFTGDSSTVYTVRIWSTDSCSKVLPVHVKVNPKPKFESIQITPSGCGKSTGSIAAVMDTAQAPYQYTLDNQAPQPDSAFTGLASGNYVLSVENVHGCTNDTLLTIHEELSVTASFITNPVTGSAPLWVQTENTSTNATDYLWEWSGGTTTDEHPGFTLDTAGNYTLTLIAYDGAPHCSDTFSLQVLVYDSLQVSIPNVFTPNQDGRNDFFGITTNVSVSGKVSLFNRWGNPLHELEFTTQPQVFEPLWEGTDATEGVYFYQLELTTNTETHSYSGFVQLVK